MMIEATTLTGPVNGNRLKMPFMSVASSHQETRRNRFIGEQPFPESFEPSAS